MKAYPCWLGDSCFESFGSLPEHYSEPTERASLKLRTILDFALISGSSMGEHWAGEKVNCQGVINRAGDVLGNVTMGTALCRRLRLTVAVLRTPRRFDYSFRQIRRFGELQR